MRWSVNMPKRGVQKIKGSYTARGRKFGIVVSQFNEFLTSRLLEGAVDTLVRHGAREKDILVVYVPGAFEIPLAARKLLAKRKVDAVITLAVVIRGQTRHFDQVVTGMAQGIGRLCEKSGTPIILGMVSARSVGQATNRVGIKQANKGREWALSAIEMANLMRRL